MADINSITTDFNSLNPTDQQATLDLLYPQQKLDRLTAELNAILDQIDVGRTVARAYVVTLLNTLTVDTVVPSAADVVAAVESGMGI